MQITERIPDPESSEPLRVLLIEDSLTQLLFLRDALERRTGRFEIKEARKLSDAVKRPQDDSFDVVLTDLGLPDSEALETVKRLIQHVRGTPLVVLTSLDDERIAGNAIRAGAHEYLLKQEITGSAVARVIRHVNERQRMQHELQQAQKVEAELDNAYPPSALLNVFIL